MPCLHRPGRRVAAAKTVGPIYGNGGSPVIWHAMRMRGGKARRLGPMAVPEFIWRGTLICDLDLADAPPRTEPILHAASGGGEASVLSLHRDEAGPLRLVHRRGARCSVLGVGTDGLQGVAPVRVTYHWDARAGLAQLTAEQPATGAIRQSVGADPPGLTRRDMVALLAPDAAGAETVSGVAVGAGWQPVGVGPCFGGSTPVLTVDGPVPVAALSAGALVMTGAGPRPVLWCGRIGAPPFGSTRPLRLVAPYHGATGDILVTPHHRVALGGPEVEYLFDAEAVLVEARHLADGRTAAMTEAMTDGGVADWYGLLFEDHHLIEAGGCRMESLYVGGLADAPELAATTGPGALVRDGRFPRHRRPAARELCDFEAATLVLNMTQRRGPVAA